METSDIIPIIIAIVASIPGILAFFSAMKGAKNDSVRVAQESAIAIIEPLRTEVDRLHKCIEELEKDKAEKEARIVELESMCWKVAALEKILSEKESRIQELERLVAEKDTKIRVLQDEIDNLTERVEVVEKRRRPLPPLKTD
jgi:chromosome segregation ATPase